MTVRTAELLMAILMLLASIGIMVKSAELNIGWIPERGPGAGAWPFWLAAGMALCCVWTLVRWVLGQTAESRSLEAYIPRDTWFIVFVTVGALVALLLATRYIGMYFSLMGFLLFYVVFVGGHSLYMGLSFMIGVPVFIFCLFEWALKTTLPQGNLKFEIDDGKFWAMEELYYPLYDIIYAPNALTFGGSIVVWVFGAILVGGLDSRCGRSGVLGLGMVLLLGGIVFALASAGVLGTEGIMAGLLGSVAIGLAYHFLTVRRATGGAEPS